MFMCAESPEVIQGGNDAPGAPSQREENKALKPRGFSSFVVVVFILTNVRNNFVCVSVCGGTTWKVVDKFG